MGYLELPQVKYELLTEHTVRPSPDIVPNKRLMPGLLDSKNVYILDSHSGNFADDVVCKETYLLVFEFIRNCYATVAK